MTNDEWPAGRIGDPSSEISINDAAIP